MDGNNIDSKCFRYENANLNKGSNKQAFMDFSQKKIGEKLSAGSKCSCAETPKRTDVLIQASEVVL